MVKTDDPGASHLEKWTEITLLPEWEEEYYLVYTAKKHGKWVMLKTLKPEYADNPDMRAMIEKEFDVRYNLAHPHIVMINDFEDVPGLGRCIITDDVYGDSLRKLIDEGKVTPEIIEKLRHDLVDAIDYIQTNHIVHHPIRPETIIFTENIGNLKLIDVGFDQRQHMEPADMSEDIYNYGLVLSEALPHRLSRNSSTISCHPFPPPLGKGNSQPLHQNGTYRQAPVNNLDCRCYRWAYT